MVSRVSPCETVKRSSCLAALLLVWSFQQTSSAGGPFEATCYLASQVWAERCAVLIKADSELKKSLFKLELHHHHPHHQCAASLPFILDVGGLMVGCTFADTMIVYWVCYSHYYLPISFRFRNQFVGQVKKIQSREKNKKNQQQKSKKQKQGQTTALLSKLSALSNVSWIPPARALKAELAECRLKVTKADSCSCDFGDGEWTLKSTSYTFARSSYPSLWINNKQHAGELRYNYPLWSASLVSTMWIKINTLSGAMAFMFSLGSWKLDSRAQPAMVVWKYQFSHCTVTKTPLWKLERKSLG